MYERWDEFRAWAARASFDAAEPLDPGLLRTPVPRPPQVFAIGLNYAMQPTATPEPPAVPMVFTKFASCLTGPYADVVHPGGSVDWEVELVVVVARYGYRIPAAEAWSYVAGISAGQDLSERRTQNAGPVPQFNLGKSFPGFGPVGPWVVTPDEVDDPDDLALECWVNGELVQKARTSEMLLSVPVLLERLSAITPLLPGDLVFTGTPAGVGERHDPPRFLQVGDVVVTKVSGVGDLRTVLVAQEA
ncbi:MAG TPA: fumarylacetoacetate hydrolase family protein [Cellulomonas sp.]